MSADNLFSEGNEAFVDDDYNLAVQKYTAAIELNSHNPKYYTQRAAAFLKLERYKDAVADASSAFTLDSNNAKACLRKGIALFHLKEFNNAKEALDKALELNATEEIKKWIEKCASHLEPPVKTVFKEPKSNEPVALKTVPKPRYDWYQTDARVVVTILVKNRTSDDVKCDIQETSLSVCIKLEDESEYTLSFNLANPIVASQSKFKVTTTKIEIQLQKAEGIRWSSLDAKSETHFSKFPSKVEVSNPTVSSQMYPTSSHIHRNWDKLAADIEKEEKDEKLEGDAALNALFQKIYGEGSDEVKRAMNKSFVESGGTVLSTNWSEVGKKKVECKPPDGMEFKKY